MAGRASSNRIGEFFGAAVLWWQKPRRTRVVPESTGLIGLDAGALPSGRVCKVSARVGRYGSLRDGSTIDGILIV